VTTLCPPPAASSCFVPTSMIAAGSRFTIFEGSLLNEDILASMGRPLAKKSFAVLGTLGTMAGIWWFALRPRFHKRP
jgi:hypothetical protein